MKFGKELYSIRELYRIFYYSMRSIKTFMQVKSKNKLDAQFVERIMLAVTEVNGCSFCSYAHTKLALEAGMSDEEIKNMLSSVLDDVPKSQVLAIMFAQHYADSRGKPSKQSFERLIGEYGQSKSLEILSVIRVIMLGNALGIAIGSLINRFKGEPDERSSLWYEAKILVTGVMFLPLSLIHALLASILGISTTKFEKN